MKHISHKSVEDWLYQTALPFWAEHGVDPSGQGAWEAISHDGNALKDRNKRIRVHPRQAYVFAKAASDGYPQYLHTAQGLFDYVMTSGFNAASGHLIDFTTPDGSVSGRPHRLYDLAFVLLANAALIEAGVPQISGLEQAKTALASLDTPAGWMNDANGSLPRAQNPYMHLFEACTELFKATGDEVWKTKAAFILVLFRSHFMREDGAVLEFFAQDWSAVEDGQKVEPGHIFEWVWLLDQYETSTGDVTNVDFECLFDKALKSQRPLGLFPDASEPSIQTHRLWVQCEAIKAAIVMSKRGYDVPETATPQYLVDLFFHHYLSPPTAGGWFDQLDHDGRVISTDMPSSSLYHIYVALRAYLDMA